MQQRQQRPTLIFSIFGVGMGFTFGLGAGTLKLGDGLRAGLSMGVTSGFVCLLLAVLLSRGKIARASNGKAKKPERSAWYAFLSNKHLARGVFIGAFVGLGMGIPFVLLHDQQLHAPISGLPIDVLVSELIFGLLYGAEAALLSVILVGKSSAIQPVEQLVWSWSSLWRSLTSTRHLLDGVLLTLIFGFFFGLFELSTGLILRLVVGLVFGLTFGLSYWLLFGFFQTVKGEMLDEQSHVLPNQGIYRSARNGLLFGCISGGISASTLGLGFVLLWVLGMILISVRLAPAQYSVPALAALGTALDITWHYGLFIGLACGLLLGLLNGWLACLRHVVLRWLLWRRKAVPWNYPRFLNYTAERILLRRVGGGYIFVHRLLLEYFVDVEAGAMPDVSKSPTQFRV